MRLSVSNIKWKPHAASLRLWRERHSGTYREALKQLFLCHGASPTSPAHSARHVWTPGSTGTRAATCRAEHPRRHRASNRLGRRLGGDFQTSSEFDDECADIAVGLCEGNPERHRRGEALTPVSPCDESNLDAIEIVGPLVDQLAASVLALVML